MMSSKHQYINGWQVCTCTQDQPLQYNNTCFTYFAVSTTPVLNAARLGDMDKLRELLENKYNINFTDSSGQAPLHYACSNGNLEVVKMLISEFKANVNSTDSVGRTPLHNTCFNTMCSFDIDL